MNLLLWVLQILTALLFGASGVMKAFLFDKVSEGVPSFGALSSEVWKTLGIVELVCAVGLIVPAALHWHSALTVVAAAILAIESLLFIWVHVKYREVTTILMSAVLGLMMAFIVIGRISLSRSPECVAVIHVLMCHGRRRGFDRLDIYLQMPHHPGATYFSIATARA